MKKFNTKLHDLINKIYSFPFSQKSFMLKPDNIEQGLNIIISHDSDFHILPLVKLYNDVNSIQFDEQGNPIGINEEAHFSVSNPYYYPLLILAQSIKQQNNDVAMIYKNIDSEENYQFIYKNCKKYLNVEPGTYKTVHDDCDGNEQEYLELIVLEDKIIVKTNGYNSLRFRSGFGGGRNLKVRNALGFLAYCSLNPIPVNNKKISP